VSPIDFADLHHHAAALDWSSLQLAAEEAYAPFGAITAEGLAKMGIYGGAYHDGAGTTADYWEGAKGWCLPGWRVFQHTFQDTIVNLHGVVEGAIGKQNSWGFTIALFTFCVRTVILPVTWLQYSGSERVKALKPYIDKIKAKYPDNERMQQALVGKMYQDTESNPLAGCLPSFAQIPIFISLYSSVKNLAVDGVLDESFLWIPNLDGPQYAQVRGMDWLTTAFTGNPALGWENTLAFAAIPIALVATQSLAMSFSAPEIDEDDPGADAAKRTALIIKFLPLLIGYFSANVPAALGIYWFTSNTFTTVASFSIKQYFKNNPMEMTWDYLEGLEEGTVATSAFDLPKSMTEAFDVAAANARPLKLSRRHLAAEGHAPMVRLETMRDRNLAVRKEAAAKSLAALTAPKGTRATADVAGPG